MKITVLMENTALDNCGLSAEHGLSFYVEYRGKKLLLDAGSSGKFADNAAALGVDLSQVELAVLSHGHYDHADGLRRFFQCNADAPVYVRTDADGPYFSIKRGQVQFIGIQRELWKENEARFRKVDGTYHLGEGMWLLPKTVTVPAFSSQEKSLFRKRGEDDFVPDSFEHEQTLVLEGDEGLVVFNSCSHGGIVNIVHSVQEQLPGKPIKAVLGGFHLHTPGVNELNCTPDYVRSVARELKALGVESIWTGHCTGPTALGLLQEKLGQAVQPLTAGLTIEWN